MLNKQLERYNHLRYKNESTKKDDFVDFIYEHTELNIPDVDVDAVWSSVASKIQQPKNRSTNWLRIAASVVLLLGAGLFVWKLSSSTNEVSIVATNNRMNVTFPDGSLGVLNKSSEFTFPEKFGEIRLVKFSGEAFFDIKKSNKPFIIETGEIKVKVLGTAFNLVNSGSEVELYVERGLVAFEKEGEQTKVPAGLKAVFKKESGKIEISENPSANITSWMNGVFVFNNTPLTSALKDLSDYYNFEFKFQNTKIENCHVTATFDKRTLSEVISTLESILDLKIESKGKQLKISGKGC